MTRRSPIDRGRTRGAVDNSVLVLIASLGGLMVTAVSLILYGLQEVEQERAQQPADAPAVETDASSGIDLGIRIPLPDEEALPGATGETALLLAETGRWRELREAVAEGLPPDPPVTEMRSRTALMYAAYAGRFGVAQALIDAGARPDRRDGGGMTALILATDHHHFDIARMLLDAGADASAVSAQGGGTLNGPARQGKNGLIERLLEGGADPNGSFGEGWRPLHYAAGGGHNGAVRRLLAAGADIHATDDGGLDALMYAAGQGHLSTVAWLLERGADRSRRARDGRTAEEMAAAGGFEDTVLVLQAK